MEPLPVLLRGREEPWLSAEVRRLLAGAGLRARYAFVDECPTDSPGCVVATDDLAGVQLQRTLHHCVRRIRGNVIVVLAFDDPLQALELLGIPFVRACFPLRDPATAAAALADLAASVAPPTVDRRFADLSPSLAVGLRLALRRSRDAHGAPPPRSVAELARQIGCRPETLYRAAAQSGLPLTDILLVSCGRWLLLRLRNVGGGGELARELGFDSAVGLRRFVKRALGCSLPRARFLTLESIDARLEGLFRGHERSAS